MVEEVGPRMMHLAREQRGASVAVFRTMTGGAPLLWLDISYIVRPIKLK